MMHAVACKRSLHSHATAQIFGPVAQLVRAPPCHGGGRGFEPHPGRLRFTSADAGVAELADAQDLKSCGTNLPYRFDSGCRHIEEAQILELSRV